jgi:hypothetical protein
MLATVEKHELRVGSTKRLELHWHMCGQLNSFNACILKSVKLAVARSPPSDRACDGDVQHARLHACMNAVAERCSTKCNN